jgi:hypothetical protein
VEVPHAGDDGVSAWACERPEEVLLVSMGCVVLFLALVIEHPKAASDWIVLIGDASVRAAQVHMFLDVAKEVCRMCEIPYAYRTDRSGIENAFLWSSKEIDLLRTGLKVSIL